MAEYIVCPRCHASRDAGMLDCPSCKSRGWQLHKARLAARKAEVWGGFDVSRAPQFLSVPKPADERQVLEPKTERDLANAFRRKRAAKKALLVEAMIGFKRRPAIEIAETVHDSIDTKDGTIRNNCDRTSAAAEGLLFEQRYRLVSGHVFKEPHGPADK